MHAAKPEAKWRRSLRAILERSGSDDPKTWLHRFEAERLVGEHCLPSTVSELAAVRGLKFQRADVEVPGYGGSVARVTSYRLDPDAIPLARALLAAGIPAEPFPISAGTV